MLPGKLSGSAMFTKYIFGFEVIYFSRYMFSYADVNCCLPELELGLKNSEKPSITAAYFSVTILTCSKTVINGLEMFTWYYLQYHEIK